LINSAKNEEVGLQIVVVEFSGTRHRYHITNNQSINKNDLLQLFEKYTKKDIDIVPVEKNGIDKSFVDTINLISYVIPSYDEMVQDVVKLMIGNPSLYKQYTIG